MNVCHITSAHSPFDVRIFHKECRSLARAGHDVTIIAPADFAERVVEGVRIIGVTRPRRRYQRVRVWREILHHVRRIQPEVVHFHDPEFLLLVPLLEAYHVIYDCHERNDVAVANKPWIAQPLRRPLSRLVSILEPALARRATAVILVDDTQVATFNHLSIPKIMVKNFPIIEEIPTHDWHTSTNAVIHTGAQAITRGTTVMIEAAALAAEKVPDIELWLVGPINHVPYRQEVRDLISELHLDDTVKVVGSVPYAESLAWIARAGIGLVGYQSVTQYENCVPTKLIEYMSAGIPAIASDVPANRRILGNLNCGFLVEPSDPREYADAIVYLLTHKTHARELGANGRQAALTKYNWSREEEKLLTLYADIKNQPTDQHEKSFARLDHATPAD